MATYTSNYAWTKPGGNDQVDISVLNGNLDSQDAIMHKAFTNMAQAFSQLSTYAVGDIVLYDNELYKCHTAVTVAGAWTGSTNWTSWTLAEGGGGGGTSNYNDLTNKPSINGVTLSGNKTTSDFGISYNDLTNKPSLATVATSGSYADLSSKPENANTFQGTIAEWNQLSTAEKKAYDHASIPDSIDGGVTFPANKVVLTGGGNVEDAIDELAEKIIQRTYSIKSSSTAIYNVYAWNANIEVEGYIPIMYCFQYGDSVGVKMGCENFSNTGMSGFCSQGNHDIIIRVLYMKA